MTNEEVLNSIREGASSNSSQLYGWLLLAATLLVFGGLGAFHWNVRFTALLAAAIFIHEAGHLLAMKIYRYKNLKMMFIPLIGGLAQGETDDHDAFKIAIIAFAGPMVGIVSCWISAALWHYTQQAIYLEYARLSLFINLFNLLPLLPLDGGHILNELLFARFPKVEAVFRFLAGIGLALLALRFHSWVLGILAYLMLVSLSMSYKLSRAASRLRHMDGFKGDALTEEKIAVIRDELKKAAPRYEEASHIKRLPREIKALWASSNKAFPSTAASVLVSVLYIVVTLAMSVATLIAIHV